MAENPLLPDAELRRLHRSLRGAAKSAEAQRVRQAPKEASPPALWAATLLQVQAGDLFITHGQDLLAARLLEGRRWPARGGRPTLLPVASSVPRIPYAAGLAAAQRRLGQGVAVCVASAQLVWEGWLDALLWAQADSLPLLLLVADASGQEAFRSATPNRDALNWGNLQRASRRSGLPALSFDGLDAVATYRVVQESMLRARSGGGPVVLWAALPVRGQGSAAAPLARLERYLQARGIATAP